MAERKGSALVQFLAVLVLGAALGVVLDLSAAHSVLRDPAVMIRDLDLQPVVRALDADDVAQAVLEGRVRLVDGRSKDEFESSRVAGSIRARVESSKELNEDEAAELAGLEVIAVTRADDVEGARLLAQRLVLYHGAATAATVDGGFEALAATGLPLEEGAP